MNRSGMLCLGVCFREFRAKYLSDCARVRVAQHGVVVAGYLVKYKSGRREVPPRELGTTKGAVLMKTQTPPPDSPLLTSAEVCALLRIDTVAVIAHAGPNDV
jgi:hypothetical protein